MVDPTSFSSPAFFPFSPSEGEDSTRSEQEKRVEAIAHMLLTQSPFDLDKEELLQWDEEIAQAQIDLFDREELLRIVDQEKSIEGLNRFFCERGPCSFSLFQELMEEAPEESRNVTCFLNDKQEVIAVCSGTKGRGVKPVLWEGREKLMADLLSLGPFALASGVNQHRLSLSALMELGVVKGGSFEVSLKEAAPYLRHWEFSLRDLGGEMEAPLELYQKMLEKMDGDQVECFSVDLTAPFVKEEISLQGAFPREFKNCKRFTLLGDPKVEGVPLLPAAEEVRIEQCPHLKNLFALPHCRRLTLIESGDWSIQSLPPLPRGAEVRGGGGAPLRVVASHLVPQVKKGVLEGVKKLGREQFQQLRELVGVCLSASNGEEENCITLALERFRWSGSVDAFNLFFCDGGEVGVNDLVGMFKSKLGYLPQVGYVTTGEGRIVALVKSSEGESWKKESVERCLERGSPLAVASLVAARLISLREVLLSRELTFLEKVVPHIDLWDLSASPCLDWWGVKEEDWQWREEEFERLFQKMDPSRVVGFSYTPKEEGAASLEDRLPESLPQCAHFICSDPTLTTLPQLESASYIVLDGCTVLRRFPRDLPSCTRLSLLGVPLILADHFPRLAPEAQFRLEGAQEVELRDFFEEERDEWEVDKRELINNPKGFLDELGEDFSQGRLDLRTCFPKISYIGSPAIDEGGVRRDFLKTLLQAMFESPSSASSPSLFQCDFQPSEALAFSVILALCYKKVDQFTLPISLPLEFYGALPHYANVKKITLALMHLDPQILEILDGNLDLPLLTLQKGWSLIDVLMEQGDVYKSEELLKQAFSQEKNRKKLGKVMSGLLLDSMVLEKILTVKELGARLHQILGEESWDTLCSLSREALQKEIEGELSASLLIDALQWEVATSLPEGRVMNIHAYLNRWINEATAGERARFLEQVSASVRLPKEGGGVFIQLGSLGADRIPSAHTCASALTLSVDYPSYKHFKAKLERFLEEPGMSEL